MTSHITSCIEHLTATNSILITLSISNSMKNPPSLPGFFMRFSDKLVAANFLWSSCISPCTAFAAPSVLLRAHSFDRVQGRGPEFHLGGGGQYGERTNEWPKATSGGGAF